MAVSTPVLEEGYLNSLIEIITVHNDLIDYARIHAIGDEGLELMPCRPEQELPELYYGTPVKINVYNFRMGFKVLSGIVTRSGAELLKIGGLEMLVASDRRQFLRVKTNALGEVLLLDEKTGQPTGRPVRVHIEDLSLGGLQFSSPQTYPLGGTVLIKMRLFEFYLELQCNIQRIVKGSGLNLSYYYGCQYSLTYEEEETMHRILLRLQQRKRAHRSIQ